MELVVKPGTTVKTGSWRSQWPNVTEKCTRCGTCEGFCPDHCMIIGSKKAEPDLDYCKGCGVCAQVCPFKAIEMVENK
ncbi:MAG: 4Fe-4S binding protein [Candidatus Micrarchaeota archaeon]|nr:4Fe-4S binding protein [Candidatus Micrarchaeota archaeon]